MIKETFTIKLTYEMSVDTDTGEILETKLIKREVDSPKSRKIAVHDEETEPKLYLEDNKYRLNSAAVKLLNLDEDSKLSIKYIQGKNCDIPVIEVDERGNKITKSNTVAYRGSKNEELAKYGKEFIITHHPNNSELFILTSESVKPEQLIGDNNITVEGEEDEDIPFDLDLKELADDTNITKIDSNFFKL